MERPVIYFDRTGPENTDLTLQAARKRALDLGISNLIVASTHGDTGLKALEIFKNTKIQIIVVGISFSYKSEGWDMSSSVRKELEDQGAKIVISHHVLSDDIIGGVSEQGIPHQHKIIAETLRRFSQGVKVAVEITIMAAEAGVIDTDHEVISIGGTHQGVDTALVVKPSYARNFYDFEIREIIAKPRIPKEK
jgi:hypothetical protein